MAGTAAGPGEGKFIRVCCAFTLVLLRLIFKHTTVFAGGPGEANFTLVLLWEPTYIINCCVAVLYLDTLLTFTMLTEALQNILEGETLPALSQLNKILKQCRDHTALSKKVFEQKKLETLASNLLEHVEASSTSLSTNGTEVDEPESSTPDQAKPVYYLRSKSNHNVEGKSANDESPYKTDRKQRVVTGTPGSTDPASSRNAESTSNGKETDFQLYSFDRQNPYLHVVKKTSAFLKQLNRHSFGKGKVCGPVDGNNLQVLSRTENLELDIMNFCQALNKIHKAGLIAIADDAGDVSETSIQSLLDLELRVLCRFMLSGLSHNTTICDIRQSPTLLLKHPDNNLYVGKGDIAIVIHATENVKVAVDAVEVKVRVQGSNVGQVVGQQLAIMGVQLGVYCTDTLKKKGHRQCFCDGTLTNGLVGVSTSYIGFVDGQHKFLLMNATEFVSDSNSSGIFEMFATKLLKSSKRLTDNFKQADEAEDTDKRGAAEDGDIDADSTNFESQQAPGPAFGNDESGGDGNGNDNDQRGAGNNNDQSGGGNDNSQCRGGNGDECTDDRRFMNDAKFSNFHATPENIRETLDKSRDGKKMKGLKDVSNCYPNYFIRMRSKQDEIIVLYNRTEQWVQSLFSDPADPPLNSDET